MSSTLEKPKPLNISAREIPTNQIPTSKIVGFAIGLTQISNKTTISSDTMLRPLASQESDLKRYIIDASATSCSSSTSIGGGRYQYDGQESDDDTRDDQGDY